MKMKIYLIALIMIFFSHIVLPQVEWKRSEEKNSESLELFRSTQVFNLPTTETIQKNNLEFEISHRFIPDIKSGSKDLWGFDGPVNIRLALGYAISNNFLVTLGRSNADDNVDLWAKWKALEIRNSALPSVISFRAGAAWNTDAPTNARENTSQYYGQLIFNTMFKRVLGLGIVPSYLYNSYLPADDAQYSFTMGLYVQYYASEMLGLMLEWNPTVTGFRKRTNPVSFGFELNTGGHFFKILLSNSTDLNPSQFLSGAHQAFNSGEWHIGFNITRLLNL